MASSQDAQQSGVNKLTQGCTVLSYIAGLFGYTLKEEDCCDEHDLAYEQGGSLYGKVQADYRLAKCVIKRNGWLIGSVKSLLGLVALTILPYPYRAYKSEGLMWPNTKPDLRPDHR